MTLSQCDSNNHRPGYAHHISHDALLNSGIAQEVLMGGHSIYLPKIRVCFFVFSIFDTGVSDSKISGFTCKFSKGVMLKISLNTTECCRKQ